MAEEHQGKGFFGVHNVFEIKSLSGIKLSPGGGQIVCVTTTPDITNNSREDHITLISTGTREFRVICKGSSPQWSPDGKQIAFQSSENGQSGIWTYDLKSGKRKFLVAVYESFYFIDHLSENNFLWSPDGSFLAYVSTSPFSDSVGHDKEVVEINRLLYKTKGGYGRPFVTDDYFTHIWIIPTEGGVPELITPGNFNEHSISWSPDSMNVVFISNRSADPDNNQRSDVWRVNIQTKEITRLTAHAGTAFQPRWSPDGNHIAYLATVSQISTNDSQSDDMHLYVISPNGGIPRDITRLLDRRVENVQWHPHENAIYFTAGNKGALPLYRLSITAEEIEMVIGNECHIPEYSFDAEGSKLAYLRTDIAHPSEIFFKDIHQPVGEKITDQNDTLLQRCRLQHADEFWFASFDETSVQGWIMKPSVFDDSKTYPLILVIHGGPHNMYGYTFEPSIQLLSAQGYAVAFINPRGSSGYGQAFSKGNVLNWGGGDYRDLMAGVDFLIRKYKWIDEKNLGVTGQSYGGYMTNWIITQTNRFKAAIVDGGISNLISFSGTSLYHSLMESEFNGSVYDNFPLLWQWSPLRNVKNIRTPTLFLHGRTDNEVPVSQAEEMYIALKKLGVTTSLVQYLEEGHGWRPDLKPKNRYDLYNRMLGWFDKYLRN
jgi:dipeptidyl aminopeptidase/acylaminoacyl peptidase